MTNLGNNALATDIVSRLRGLGYSSALLQENYAFSDWFSSVNEERTLLAAAFGQTPISYDSALIGVAAGNGLRGRSLVNAFRAFGAPVLLEIDDDRVHEWAVSRSEREHLLIGTYRHSSQIYACLHISGQNRPNCFSWSRLPQIVRVKIRYGEA